MTFYETGDIVKVFANDGKHPFPGWVVKLIDDGCASVDFDNETEGGKLEWVDAAYGARVVLTADNVITHNPAASRDTVCIFDTFDDFLSFHKLAPDSPDESALLLRSALRRRFEELNRNPGKTAEEAMEADEELRAMAPYLDWLTRKTRS